jgi:hypothetical protein
MYEKTLVLKGFLYYFFDLQSHPQVPSDAQVPVVGFETKFELAIEISLPSAQVPLAVLLRPTSAITMHHPDDNLASFAGGEGARDALLKQNQCDTSKTKST